jgi:hypothetical protein
MAEILEGIAFVCAVYGIGLNIRAGKYSVRHLGGMVLLGILQCAFFAAAHPFARDFLLPFADTAPDLLPLLRGANLFFVILFSLLSLKDALEWERTVRYADLLRYIIDVRADRIIAGDMPFLLKPENDRYTFTFFHNPGCERNFFLRYAVDCCDAHLRLNRCANTGTFSLTKADLRNIAQKLGLLLVKNAEYIRLNGCDVAIRHAGFSYTVCVKKADLPRLSADVLEANAQIEDAGAYRRYRNLRKPEVSAWLEGFRFS